MQSEIALCARNINVSHNTGGSEGGHWLPWLQLWSPTLRNVFLETCTVLKGTLVLASCCYPFDMSLQDSSGRFWTRFWRGSICSTQQQMLANRHKEPTQDGLPAAPHHVGCRKGYSPLMCHNDTVQEHFGFPDSLDQQEASRNCVL